MEILLTHRDDKGKVDRTERVDVKPVQVSNIIDEVASYVIEKNEELTGDASFDKLKGLLLGAGIVSGGATK